MAFLSLQSRKAYSIYIPLLPPPLLPHSCLSTPLPQLLPYLSPQLLHRNLRLQNPTYALPPRFFQALHLSFYLPLSPGPQVVHLVYLPLGIREFLLNGSQFVLGMVIGEQPRVGTMLIEESQVLDARLEVRVGGVRFGQDGPQLQGGRCGGLRRARQVLGLVALRVDGSEGRGRCDPGHFRVHGGGEVGGGERREVWCRRGGELGLDEVRGDLEVCF